MQINRQTYTEFFLLYVDNELDMAHRKEVEKFIELNPDLAQELELFKQTTFPAEMDVVFNNKSVLYRKEEDRKVIPFGWWKMAVAAMLLLAVGAGGWNYFVSRNKSAITPVVAETEKKINTEVVVTPKDIREPAKLKETNAPVKTTVVVVKKNKENKATNITTPLLPEENVTRNNKNDDGKEIHPIQPEISTAKNEDNIEDIKNSVASLKPNDEQFAENNLTAQKSTYKNVPEDNNLIYFANTSFSKKTKFREVFRKASRVFEKVTSIGSGSDLLRKNDMEISTQ